MRQTFLDTAEDMQWLRDVHCPDLPSDMRCAILTGNEDAPASVQAWRAENPHYQAPAEYARDFHATEARLAIQCASTDGRTGTFLFTGDIKAPSLVSPVMPDCVALFSWCNANGWKSVPGPSPVGNYAKMES